MFMYRKIKVFVIMIPGFELQFSIKKKNCYITIEQQTRFYYLPEAIFERKRHGISVLFPKDVVILLESHNDSMGR